MTARLVSVNAGRTRPAEWARPLGRTAIDKRPLDGPVQVGPLGLTADEQADTAHHGGPAQAIYAYAREDAAYWEREFDRPLPPGAFGENFSTAGLPVTGAVIGERWRVGDAVEVTATSPRIPCSVFAGFWDVPQLVKRFSAYGEVGAYFAVAVPGEVAAGDPIQVLDRPAHGVTVRDFFRGWLGDRALLGRVAELPELHELDRAAVRRRLAGR